jgi:hypothetical protein
MIFFWDFYFQNSKKKKKKNHQISVQWFKWIAKNIDGYVLNDFDISCKAKFG